MNTVGGALALLLLTPLVGAAGGWTPDPSLVPTSAPLGLGLPVTAAAGERSPSNCDQNGYSLTLRIMKDAAATIPQGTGTEVESAQSLFYQAIIAPAPDTTDTDTGEVSVSCDFVGEDLYITTPDGVSHNMGAIGRVDRSRTYESPTQEYVVSKADVRAGPQPRLDVNVSFDYTSLDGGDSEGTGSGSAFNLYKALKVGISMTAVPSKDSVCDWTIDKSVDPTSLRIEMGDSADAQYDIDLVKSCVDVNESVDGSITITNPALYADALVSDVAQAVGSVAGTVTCPGGVPASIAPGATLECTYTSVPADQSDGVSSVAVTTSGDIEGNTSSTPYSFVGVGYGTIHKDSVTVSDTMVSETRTFSASGTWTYPKTFRCGTGAGEYGLGTTTVTNTATIQDGDSDDATIDIECYEVVLGPTRTIGFWSTHHALASATWQSIPSSQRVLCADRHMGDGVNDVGEMEGAFWSDISRTTAGAKRGALDQARMILAQQLVASMLNVQAFGALGTTDDGLIADGKAAFCGSDRESILSAAAALDAFNNGGDDVAHTGWQGPTDPKGAQRAALKSYWDVFL